MNLNITYSEHSRLEYQINKFLADQDFTHHVTLAFNEWRSLPSARETLRQWHGRVDRALLGRSWQKRSLGCRTLFLAFAEHIDSNIHYHLLVRPASARIGYSFDIATEHAWRNLVQGGSVAVSPIYDAIGISHYVTKDLWQSRNYENFVVSTEFVSHN